MADQDNEENRLRRRAAGMNTVNEYRRYRDMLACCAAGGVTHPLCEGDDTGAENMRYRGLTAVASNAECGVISMGENTQIARAKRQRRQSPWRLRLATKTVNNSAARDQTIVDYHDSRQGKVSARDFQPINLPLARTTISPPPS